MFRSIPPLPGCPRLENADPSLRERYLAFLAQEEAPSSAQRSTDWHQLAQTLAADLHAEAHRLGTSRLHESSLDILFLGQCAALVALKAFGSESPSFQMYAKAVRYYARFPDEEVRAVVHAFDDYVRAYPMVNSR